MGTWGTALSSNDIYADIYFEFFELYNEGHSVQDISAKLIAENAGQFDDDDNHNFWFALAKAQWECKALDPNVLAEVTDIIANGRNIAAWRELGASESDLKKRQAALDKILAMLHSERPKARVRRRKSTVIHQPLYRKGDCLGFTFRNGNYGGVLVLEEVAGTRHEGSYNLIATTDINLPHKPSVQDFMRANVLHGKLQDIDFETGQDVWKDYTMLTWHSSTSKDQEDFTILIGNIPIQKQYRVDDYEGVSYTGPFNLESIKVIDEMLTSGHAATKHGRTPIKEYI